MADFPAFENKPDPDEFEESPSFDPTIRSRSFGGLLKTRPRCTRIPDVFKVVYSRASEPEKDAMRTFEKSVKVGSDSFTWPDHPDGVSRTVRLKEPVVCKSEGSRVFWRISMTLEEV